MEDLFVWRPDFSVSVETIDIQHRQLLSQMNGFYKAVLSGQGQGRVRDAIDFLVGYVDIHFSTEEYFMVKYGYSLYPTHRKEHQRLSAAVLRSANNVAETHPTRDVVSQLVTEMGAWILEHVQKMDKTLGRFLKSLGPELDSRVPDDLTSALKRLKALESPVGSDNVCPHVEYCSRLFASFQDVESKGFWEERFCLDSGRRENCRRKEKLDRGAHKQEVLKTMLPNGDRLRHLSSAAPLPIHKLDL